MKIQLSLKVLPHQGSQKDVYDRVNEAIGMIDESKLKYITGPNETTIEGEYDEIFALVKKIHDYLIDNGVDSLSMIIMTGYNKEDSYIDEKLENVSNYLGKK